MRKALMAEQSKSDMESRIKALEKENEELKQEIEDKEKEIEEMIKREEELFLDEKKAHDDQVNYLNELNDDYQKELKQLLQESATNPAK